MSTVSRQVAAIIFSFAVVACATAGERQQSWRGPTGQTCSGVIHGAPPSVGLESLVRDGVPAPVIAGWSGPDTLLIVASYDTLGAFSGVEVFGQPGETFDAEAVADALRDRFHPEAAAGVGAVALYIHGADPDLRAHRFTEQCEPQLANGTEIGRQLENLARQGRARDRSAVAWLFSDGQGRVVQAMIDQSSGDIEVDREMLRIARQARFVPATLDGFARPVWIAIPLAINSAPHLPPSAPCPPQAAGSLACRR